uniref:hypothetical protein n=1 Tax=Enterocloster clostridioformis TaxID=1531 RepID=UPI0025B0D95B
PEACEFPYRGYNWKEQYQISRILKIGIQYLPVDSRQISVQLKERSHFFKELRSELKVANRFLT